MPGRHLLCWIRLVKRGEAALTADAGELAGDHDQAIERLRGRRHELPLELPLGLHLARAATGGATVSAVVVAETGTETDQETEVGETETVALQMAATAAERSRSTVCRSNQCHHAQSEGQGIEVGVASTAIWMTKGRRPSALCHDDEDFSIDTMVL